MDEPVALAGPDGVFAENWTEQLGDDFKEDAPTLSRFKSVGELAKSSMEARRKLGHDPKTLVKIPDETASEEIQAEQRAAFNRARGKPDTTDDYKYEIDPEIGVKVGGLDEDKLAAFKTFAHEKLNLTSSEFKDALDYYLKDKADDIDSYGVTSEEQRAQDIEKGTAELKKEWLAGFEERTLRANAVMRKYGGEEAVAEFAAENNPKMLKFLDNIASAMSESTIKGLKGVTEATAGDIKGQIATLRGKLDVLAKANPGQNIKSLPEYKTIQENLKELYKKMPA